MVHDRRVDETGWPQQSAFTAGRYTARARRVLTFASAEAQQMGHGAVGTGQILLHLMAEEEGTAFQVLSDLAITGKQAGEMVRLLDSGGMVDGAMAVVPSRGGATPAARPIPLSALTAKALEMALREALQSGHYYIGTGHLLLGMVRLGKGTGAQVLAALSGSPEGLLDQLRKRVARRMLEQRDGVPAGAAAKYHCYITAGDSVLCADVTAASAAGAAALAAAEHGTSGRWTVIEGEPRYVDVTARTSYEADGG